VGFVRMLRKQLAYFLLDCKKHDVSIKNKQEKMKSFIQWEVSRISIKDQSSGEENAVDTYSKGISIPPWKRSCPLAIQCTSHIPKKDHSFQERNVVNI